MLNRLRIWLFLLAFTSTAAAQDKPPRSPDPRLKIELFAEHPQIVTPTGLDVDSQGRVWAIESNTHFPPPDYAGHKTDRLLVMSDTNGDGRADTSATFADGFTHAMSVSVRPPVAGEKAIKVYLATRREILILTDTDGDLRVDDRQRIVHLDTPGNYPHNGLAGFAWDAQGWMYFGFGENLGAEYEIIGSDGRTLTGGGEGGNLYRCRPDGTELMRWATGFWNPHASCIDALGRMFTVDNDADSRPPCRLLHIIRDGDYGYRFRNGRKGLHPFTAWNGEIPGTLPMVAGTGEAPSGIVAYESDGLPQEYIGNLLVTSWGDHRIDRFRLKPKGASYESLAEPVIAGGENFRPVGLAVAPDGSLYCTDWVLKDYKLHGKGRVWKISAGRRSTAIPDAEPAASYHVALCRRLLEDLQGHVSAPTRWALEAVGLDDPFLFSAGVKSLASPSKISEPLGLTTETYLNERHLRDLLQRNPKWTKKESDAHARIHLAWFLAARQQQPREPSMAKVGLESSDALVRRLAVQWVAEERFKELRPQVDALFNQEPMTTDLFLATLAALEMLDGVDPANFDKTPAGKYVLPVLLDERRPAVVRTQALRLVAPDDPALKTPLIEKLLVSEDEALRLEVVRTLQSSLRAETAELLTRVAADNSASLQMRAEAIAGLAPAIAKAKSEDLQHHLVRQLLHASQRELVIETLRAMRGYDRDDKQLREALLRLDEQDKEVAEELVRLVPESDLPENVRKVAGQRPAGVEQWMTLLESAGDAEAGRRVFFHPLGAGCWKCHTVDGRGGAVGPDLSMVARTMNRQKLAQSILEPAKEIPPQFTSWTFVMTSGQVHQGMILGDTRDEKQRIGLADGRQLELRVADIELREPSPLSIMPANLIDQLTVSEFRHLLAFLETLK